MESFKKSKITSIDAFKKNKASPIIAKFQSANLSDEMASKAVCKRVSTTEDGRKYSLIATPSNIYKSEVSKDDENSFQDTYIAVHNKKTKEIKLIQVECASFKHVLYDNTHSEFEHNALDTQKILAKEFAGKKGAIVYERRQRTQINSSILEDTIDKTISTIDEDKLLGSEVDQRDEIEKFKNYIFPIVEKQALESGLGVRDIFLPENLIQKAMIKHLSEVAIDILNLESKNLPFSNKFLKNSAVLAQNTKEPDSPENLTKMSMIIYAESLISLINNRPNDLKFSNQLQNDLFRNFFISGSRQVSTFTRQKSIVFYGILSLLISNSLQVNMDDILDNLKLSKKELMKYLAVIGCKEKENMLYINKVANVGEDAKFQIPMMKGRNARKK